MSAVGVGAALPVNGRLPRSWHIAAHFDSVSGTLKLTSPDTDDFEIIVHTNSMDQYGAEHKRTSAKLADVSYVDAKYDNESGVLRFDSDKYPEFWIEVNVESRRDAAQEA